MPGRRTILLTLCFILCAAAGGLTAVAGIRYGHMIIPEMVSIDLKKILEARKAEFAQRVKTLKAANDTQALIRANAEVNTYIERLQEELARQGKQRIVFVKDAVVAADIKDITAEVEKNIERQEK